MAEKKICPFAAAQPDQESSDCLGPNCACYISIVKPVFLSKSPVIVDPENYYCYKGCGLVRVVPWQLVKREQTPKAPEDKQAEDAYAKLDKGAKTQ